METEWSSFAVHSSDHVDSNESERKIYSYFAESEKFSNRMGTIPEINKFDSLFFGMLDKHADTMDPQSRMLLEKTYEAVVDAGKCYIIQNVFGIN